MWKVNYLPRIATYTRTTPIRGFPGGLDGNKSACNAGELSFMPRSGRSPEESPQGNQACRGTFGVPWRLSGPVSNFRAEQGTSLETPSRARASSCEEVGTTWFFSSCGVILVLRRGITGFLLCRPWVAQSCILVARESWGLRSSHCRAKETSSRRVSRT